MKEISQSNAQSVLDGLFLFNQSQEHSGYCIWEFNNYFIYPLLHGKVRLFYEDNKPIGLVTWCFLSEERSQQFADEEIVLEEDDYLANEGDQLWGVEFIAPYGHARTIMRRMKELHREVYPNEYNQRPVRWKRITTGKQCRGRF